MSKPKILRFFTVIFLIFTVMLSVGCKDNYSNDNDSTETNSTDTSSVIVYVKDSGSIYSCSTEPSSTDTSSVIVYVTDSGTKYHRSSCCYLWNSKNSTDLEDAVNRGYSPCSRCNPPK